MTPSDLDARCRDQAEAALKKLMNERCSNFDKGAVIHWAERGMYSLVPATPPDVVQAVQASLEAAIQAAQGIVDMRSDRGDEIGYDNIITGAQDAIDMIRAIDPDAIITELTATARNHATESQAVDTGAQAGIIKRSVG